MTISVDEVTKIISVPKADLTLVGPGERYEQDTAAFRLELRDWEFSIPGDWRSITHLHDLPSTSGGTTLARVITIINGYTITYEDGQYRVTLIGSNNNFVDVATVNQVSIVPTNSAGLTYSTEILNIQDLNEADQFFDKSTGLLHYYRRGTTIDIIPPKNVTGEQVAADVNLAE